MTKPVGPGPVGPEATAANASEGSPAGDSTTR